MNVFLDGNEATISNFEKVLANFTEQRKYVLKNVRETKAYDKAANKVLDEVESITYTVVDPDTFSSMKVKTLTKIPVITQKKLEEADSPIFVSFPLETTIVRPYAIEYGKVKVSIIAPNAELVPASKT